MDDLKQDLFMASNSDDQVDWGRGPSLSFWGGGECRWVIRLMEEILLTS